ncbi:hypothetical protein F5884DRAFT_757859 [Xylogone sp. PMI_703]|nr:hypothetical protein F5884DRAFT_757859 [Xylogone sp. PMI_703]
MHFSAAVVAVVGLFLNSVTAVPAAAADNVAVEPSPLAHAVRQASNYQLELFSGTSCTGSNGFFGGDIATGTCRPIIGNFDSVRLVNQAGCSTVIFTDDNCQQSRFLIQDGQCSGFADGHNVGSLIVNC